MKFELIRGAEDSAPIDEFGFTVAMLSLTEFELVLKFEFSFPLSMSIGKSPEIMRTTIINPNLFTSKATGMTLIGGVVSTNELPRMCTTQ